MNRSKGLAAAACALVLGASMFAGMLPASASEDEHSSAGSNIGMTYKFKKAKFVGSVTSGRDSCLDKRVVKLFKARNNALFAKTRTNDAGRWSISAPKKSGKYYSKVVASEIVLDSGVDEYGHPWMHTLSCGGAKSGAVATTR